MEKMHVRTFGHGRAGSAELAALIRGAAIRGVFDVRSVPKSRVHPHVWAERMALWVPELAGATYVWRPELGGFRKPRPDSQNLGLRHPSFRGYADYMETPAFASALQALVEEGARQAIAVMCSESLWWRCHRRLIADALVLGYGATVTHVMHAGAPQPHRLTPGVKLLASGALRYDPVEE